MTRSVETTLERVDHVPAPETFAGPRPMRLIPGIDVWGMRMNADSMVVR